MNKWTQASVNMAAHEDYLDRLYDIYPSAPENERSLDEEQLNLIRTHFENKDNQNLILTLLDMPLFPVKDSYIAFLRQDRGSISRNPQTVERLAGRLYDMGINRLLIEVRQPKETNRQMGQRFRSWLMLGSLGVPCLSADNFLSSNENCILAGGDLALKSFAEKELNYISPNGLDLVAKFNNRYVIGEAKFITASGGHQDRQFESACAIFKDPSNAYKIAVMDGILYVPSRGRMYRYLEENENHPIFSALLLREFLNQL